MSGQKWALSVGSFRTEVSAWHCCGLARRHFTPTKPAELPPRRLEKRSGSVVGEVNDFIVLCEVVGVFPTGASGDAFVELQGRLEPTERVPDLVKFPAGMSCLTKVTGLPKGTMLVCSLPLNLCPEVQWVQPLRVYRTHCHLKARVRRHVARKRS